MYAHLAIVWKFGDFSDNFVSFSKEKVGSGVILTGYKQLKAVEPKYIEPLLKL